MKRQDVTKLALKSLKMNSVITMAMTLKLEVLAAAKLVGDE